MLKRRAFQALVCRGGPPAGGEGKYLNNKKKRQIIINILQEFNPKNNLVTTSKDLKIFNR